MDTKRLQELAGIPLTEGKINWREREEPCRILNNVALTNKEMSTLSDREIKEANKILDDIKALARKFETICYDAEERYKMRKKR